MDCEDAFRRLWREKSQFASFHGFLTLVDDRLELGAGELLARMAVTRGGEFCLVYEGGEERALARLACVYSRSYPRERTLAALRAASWDWARGEGARAYIRLAQAQLGKFEDPERAAYLLFLADYALDEEGFSPRELLKALGLEAPGPAARFIKTYDPDEPRVPAGNGRESGRWTNEDWSASDASSSGTGGARRGVAVASLATDVESFMSRDLAPEALAGLGELAESLSAPTLALGLLFIPSPGGSSVVTGAAPGQPNLSYYWDQAAGELILSQTVGGASAPFADAHLRPGGLYYDEQGDPIARVVGSSLVIDWDAATQAQSVAHGADAASQAGASSQTNEDDGQPKLCPDPGPDVPHGASADAIAYQQAVTGLPPGLAVWLNGVAFDGCRESDGTMLEAKGRGYEQFLGQNGDWLPWFRDAGAAKIENQLGNQSKAANGREIEWHVAEKRVADKIREMAKRYLNIEVVWDPEGIHAR